MYQRILVPVDGSATAEQGLREAIKLAKGQDTRLLFLHVVDDYTMLIETTTAASYEEMLKGLRQYGLEVLAKSKRAAEEAAVHCETLLREVTGKRVEDVIVDQSCRGKGLGEALTRAAIDCAGEMGAKTVDLTSRPSREAANRLYQRVGFHLRQTNTYRYNINQE